MPPWLLLVSTGLAAAAQVPGSALPRPQAPSSNVTDGDCRSQNARDVLVCAQRRQGFRLDSAVTDAAREARAARSSAGGPAPAAQSACSQQPMGCPSGLESLDLANVAVVAATTAIRAAKGQDWTTAFRSNPDEYQLYLEAKRREDAERARAAATRARDAARSAR